MFLVKSFDFFSFFLVFLEDSPSLAFARGRSARLFMTAGLFIRGFRRINRELTLMDANYFFNGITGLTGTL